MPSQHPLPNFDKEKFNLVKYKGLERDDVKFLLKQLFDLQGYSSFEKTSMENVTDKTFTSNSSFWKNVLDRNCFPNQIVLLKGFNVIEWIPFSPGTFYTDEAWSARNEAERYVNYEYNEYTPIGKYSMVKGGVGSIRLSSKLIDNVYYNFVGATSTGICHQGIPLLLNNDLYNKYIQQIKHEKGVNCDIIGRLRIIPDNILMKMNYSYSIPKYCIVVEEIKNEQRVFDDIYISIAIAYRSSFDNHQMSWTFSSFEPDKREENLRLLTRWLRTYAQRYFKIPETIVFNDFDEQTKWFSHIDFPGSVPFCVSALIICDCLSSQNLDLL